MQYSLNFLNTNADIASIIQGLRARAQATFCLYGPSDLMDKYVGGTEKLIAGMFQQALDEDAVLLLDEADSFLSDRTGAGHRWEALQTNELLTQLECFDGLFFATTNLMDKLDAACLRRFSHKVKFDYLKPDQCWGLFVQEFCRIGGKCGDADVIKDKVRGLALLSPGDLSSAVQECFLLSQCPTAVQLWTLLKKHYSIKCKGKGTLGFLILRSVQVEPNESHSSVLLTPVNCAQFESYLELVMSES